MTIASKIKRTYASLLGAEATISTYSNHHPSEATRRLMKDCQHSLKEVIEELSIRIREIEYEEGQYKGF